MAVQNLNYNPTNCLAIEDSLNGATAAMMAGLDVVVNTNLMTAEPIFQLLITSEKICRLKIL